MPRIRLRLSETRPGTLPPVCIVCGRTATLYVPKTFSWRPNTSPLLSLLVLCLCWPVALALFIVSRSQTRHMTIHTPLCERHRNYWGLRHFWLIVPLLVLVAAVALLAVLTLSELIPHEVYITLFASTIILLALWAAMAMYLNRIGVRADEITDEEIILTPVSSEFFDLVRYERTARKGSDVPPWDEYDPYPRTDAIADRKRP